MLPRLRFPIAIGMPSLLAASGCGRVAIDLLDDPLLPGDAASAIDTSRGDDGPDAARDPNLDPQEDLDAQIDADRQADERDEDRGRNDGSGDRFDAGVDDGGDAQVCRMEACDLACQGGALAIKLTVEVSWSHFVLSPGSDRAEVWLKFEGEPSPDGLAGSFRTCGMALPEFALDPQIAREHHLFKLADASFDQVPSKLPSARADLVWDRQTASLRMSPTAVLMGVRLDEPLREPWPGAPSSLDVADHDGDGAAGVRGNYLQSARYFQPVVDGLRTRRADQADFAARVIASLEGEFTSCTEASGTADVTAFDTHILACRISGAGRPCNPDERDFLDSYRQNFELGSGSFRALQLAADASCAEVRSALP